MDVRELIRTMSAGNPLWGAPRIHGELLKLGIEVSQASVAKYMVRRRQPPSQTWRTFLRNHIGQIAAADFFIVPTATYRLLFVLVILAHGSRRVVHVGVTTVHRPRGRRNNFARRSLATSGWEAVANSWIALTESARLLDSAKVFKRQRRADSGRHVEEGFDSREKTPRMRGLRSGNR